MRDGFLIGRFLKAYTSVYRYKRDHRPAVPSFERPVLEARFAERAQRFRNERLRHAVRLQIGFAVALLLIASAFQLPLHRGAATAYVPVAQELVTMEEIVQTQQRLTPPPPPRPPVPVEVPDETIIEDDDLDLDATLDLGEPLATLPPPPPPEEAEAEPEPEPELFVVVEEMPTMVGGLAAMLKDLRYPPVARQAGIEGTVVLNVIINEDGSPSDAEVVRSVHEVLDKAAVEAVLKQTFTPGLQRGRPVRVKMAIPVHFRLRDA